MVTTDKFDIATLGALYDRGRLVPFIGSGMSMPTCSSWEGLIEGLERRAAIAKPRQTGNLTLRASMALQELRQQGQDIAEVVSASIYVPDKNEVPTQTKALAALFWPLVCTTNYDDLYVRAKQGTHSTPRVFGRSEAHCREVLGHLSFPASEIVWALQGFIPRSGADAALGDEFPREQFARELVVGHAEYRKEAHRAPHFRRSFAELFRTRSLLFLGSGLGEPYFLSLFDEIIELSGPPTQPHFALVPEDTVDTEFLHKQYHILCNTYPEGQHGRVVELLERLAEYVRAPRARPGRWGFRLAAPAIVERDGSGDHFSCVRGGLPKASEIAEDEVVAISCGRGSTSVGARDPGCGVPLASEAGMKMLGLSDTNDYVCESEWTVRWTSLPRAYGIVARDRELDASSRDLRSAEAIRTAFRDFLLLMHDKGARQAHVQLLSAGRGRVFQPWVSISQMARAYGEVFREVRSSSASEPPRVSIYVVDPGVIAMLQGGHLDLIPQLEGANLRVTVEVVDAFGRAERYHEIVPADTSLRQLVGATGTRQPLVSARPIPRLQHAPEPLSAVADVEVRAFGLVSGSTLVVDYR